MARRKWALPITRLDDGMLERFWSKVDRGAPDECWLWMEGTNIGGYGSFGTYFGKRARNVGAHRYAYAATYGDPGPYLLVLHHCDNPPCCNPAHLYLGTNADNVRDKCERGGQRRGMGMPDAKLTDDDVRAMRSRYDRGDTSCVKLAPDYGVNPSTIYSVVSRRGWTHVKEAPDD